MVRTQNDYFPQSNNFKTKLPVDTFVCIHIFFLIFRCCCCYILYQFFSFSSTLIRFIYAQFFFGKQLQKHCTQNSNFFFASFFLRPITLIFASNFNLSTICQNNLAQDHPPWIFFSLSLFFSFSFFLSLNLQMVPIQRAVPQVTPICSTKNSHSSLNPIKTLKSNFKNPNTDGIDV